MRKTALVYLGLIVVSMIGIYGLLVLGSNLVGPPTAASAPAPGLPGAPPAPAAGSLLAGLLANLHHPLSLLLLQVVVVVAVAWLLGSLVARLGQPRVIGEMIAGILLGPSLLGWMMPEFETFLFPPSSLGALQLLSQIGIILFMFVVGIDLDLEHLVQQAHTAVLVSHASILVPLFLGTGLSIFIYGSLAPAGTAFTAFALFMGVAMSITAFPVLARILEERGLLRTHLGSTAIACAAVDDVTAWCLLAVVVAIVRASGASGWILPLLLTIAFIALMLLVVRPWAAQRLRFEARRPSELPDGEQKRYVTATLAFVFLCALITECIGIHALFGAFLAGVAMPAHGGFREFLKERIESVSTSFLLPLFFAFTGLRTQIGLLDDAKSWLVCLGIIAVAVVGKLGGSLVAGRWTGLSWRDSFAIGVLMNTRGLIALIVLDVGYDLGVLSPRIFAMMVLMALVTTFMTGPMLSLVRPRAASAAPAS